jgi:signal transduction histidine kinase/AmiR/NasT family two-component response regulator
MKRLLRQRTLRLKLFAVVLLTTFVALLVALGGLLAYNLHVYRESLVADLSTQAELLGHMTAPALSFDDRRLATENLSLLRLRPNVRAAAIYDARGRPFATYTLAGEGASLPKFPEADAVRTEGWTIVLFKRIVSDREIVGVVYLRADYGIVAYALGYLGIAAVVMGVAMLIAFLLSARLQKVITEPVLAISRIAREVVEQRDYSRRGVKLSDDEVGTLVDAFNDMLAEIERRTLELERSNREIAREMGERTLAQQEVMRLNAGLETRVHERTAQLEAANAELSRATAAAETANQTKSAFLSSMSHELRTPLNAILGFGQLLESESMPVTAAQKKEFVSHILKAGRHLLVLINEVLDLAKVESGTLTLSPEPVALAEVLRECREMIEPLAKEHGLRTIFPPEGAEHVLADRTRLKQILLNLLSNAIKYNRAGGSVVVACTSAAAGRLRISVQDTGAGLAADKLQQLFQPFNRLGQEAGAQEGTGIGLVVTKRLVELMGGSIGVSSNVGMGSVFWIELPVTAPLVPVADPARPGVAPAGLPLPADATTHTLLYVEDNPANLRLIEHLIAFRPDLRLLSAADAELGLELARVHQPEVILMDINLPGMSGNEALLVLHGDARTAHIPVIALSANAMPRAVAESMACGFFRYLIKPIVIDEFFDALDSALQAARSGRRAEATSVATRDAD